MKLSISASYKLIMLVVLFTITILGQAQNDSAGTVQIDSALRLNQANYNQLIFADDSADNEDDINENELLNEIASIKLSDKKRKADLQKSLDSLQKAREIRDTKIKQQIDSLRASSLGVPVIVFQDTLFYIYSKLGPLEPSDRAKSISSKLELLVKQNLYDPNELSVSAGDESSDIVHEKLILLSVTERDAFWLNKNRQEVADEYLVSIKDCVSKYQKSNSIWIKLKQLSMLILVIVILFFGIKYLNRGFTKLNKGFINKGSKYIKGVSFKNYEFLSAEQEKEAIGWLLKVSKWVVIAFIVYLALPIIFSIFPTTKGIANTLFGYVLNPIKNMGMGFISYIPELITIVVIVLITKYIVRFLKFMSTEVEAEKLQIPGFYPDWARPTFNLLKILIYAFSFVVIFPYLPGSDSTAFQGVSVFLGLLISLGSSSVIGNMLAGLVITYMRAFKIGDRVKIGEIKGDVTGKTMFVIRLRTIKNEDVTIPNASVLGGSTINYSSSSKDLGLILNSTVTIGYDVPWKKVHELLIDAALKTEHIKSEPAPFVLQTSLDDFYVSYQINATTEEASQAAKIYSELHSNIQNAFNEAGVEILSPHYRAPRDGNKIAIPADYVPEGYVTPSFNVKIDKNEDK